VIDQIVLEVSRSGFPSWTIELPTTSKTFSEKFEPGQKRISKFSKVPKSEKQQMKLSTFTEWRKLEPRLIVTSPFRSLRSQVVPKSCSSLKFGSQSETLTRSYKENPAW